MLKKVYGKSNDIDIVFEQNYEGKWETVIPRDVSGVYYLQLYAEDDAGNTTYFSTVYMKFDPSSFCISFNVVDFNGNLEMKKFIECFSVKGYRTAFKDGGNRKCNY